MEAGGDRQGAAGEDDVGLSMGTALVPFLL